MARWTINVNHSYSQALLRSHEIRVAGAVGGIADGGVAPGAVGLACGVGATVGGVNRPVRHRVHGPAIEPHDETAATGTSPRLEWSSGSSEGAVDHFGKTSAIARDGPWKRVARPRRWMLNRLAHFDIRSLPTPSK